MKNSLYIIIFLLLTYSAESQVKQISIGASDISSAFNAVKYDSSDGQTINVGSVNNPLSETGGDCFMVKLNASHQIVWQKSISNIGDDYFRKVIICANGDYLVLGVLIQAGVARGLACRVDKTNGNILWSSKSNNSSGGEEFFDAVETTNGNFCIVADDYSGISNSWVILLNSVGNTLWSAIASFAQSDGPFAINQLPNGNLITAGVEWVGHYNAVITEFDELTGSIISENAYTINTTTPNSSLTLNSLWPASIKIVNGTVLVSIELSQGCCTLRVGLAVYTYDQTSKQLTGNIYYHTNDQNVANLNYAPLAANDFLMTQSFINPTRIYISRITDGVVVYDNLIDGVSAIVGIDTTAADAVYSGNATYTGFTNAYNLFSPRTDFVSASSCIINSSNTLALQPSTLNATATNDLDLSAGPALFTAALTSQTTTSTLSNICGSVLPLTLLDFAGKYNNLNNTTLLRWSTANEFNSKIFIIERSVNNGVTYDVIGAVNAHGAANAVTDYTFKDVHPLNGNNLYRIKEIDFDNKFKYSNIVLIASMIKSSRRYYLTPNPTSSFSLINSKSPGNTVSVINVFDAWGKLIKQAVGKIDDAHPYKLLMKSIPGIYYVKIQSANSSETLKLVIQ